MIFHSYVSLPEGNKLLKNWLWEAPDRSLTHTLYSYPTHLVSSAFKPHIQGQAILHVNIHIHILQPCPCPAPVGPWPMAPVVGPSGCLKIHPLNPWWVSFFFHNCPVKEIVKYHIKSYQIWFWDTRLHQNLSTFPMKKNQLPQRAAANGRFWWPADTGPALRLVTHRHAIWKGLEFPRLFGDYFEWDKFLHDGKRENITNKAHTKSSHIFWLFFLESTTFQRRLAAAPGWWACSSWRLAPRSAVLAQPSGDSANPRRTWRLCRSPGAGWRTLHWVSELWIL